MKFVPGSFAEKEMIDEYREEVRFEEVYRLHLAGYLKLNTYALFAPIDTLHWKWFPFNVHRNMIKDLGIPIHQDSEYKEWIRQTDFDLLKVEVSRFAGWLKKLPFYPKIFGTIQEIIIPEVGMYSSLQVIDPYRLYARWPSPGKLEMAYKRLKWRADQILAPLGVRATNMAIAKTLEQGPLKSGKAALVAVALTITSKSLWTWLFQYKTELFTVRGAKGALNQGIGIWASQYACEGVKTQMHRTKVWRVLGENLAGELADIVPLAILPQLVGKRKEILKAWNELGPHDEPDIEAKAHYFLSLVKVYSSLGAANARKALGVVRSGRVNLHNLGFGLPNESLTEESASWFIRKINRPFEAGQVVTVWDRLIDEGWDPCSKESLQNAMELMSKYKYKVVEDSWFAKVAAECNVSEGEYNWIEATWLGELNGITHQTVPAPGGVTGIVEDELQLIQLRKDDPRALFAGFLTGCCQYPGAVGESCAWHAHGNSDGTIWAVFRNGTMIAQGWVWRSKNTLVIDSVEMGRILTNTQLVNRVAELYKTAVKKVTGKLGVEKVYTGTNLGWETNSIHNPMTIPYMCYTDAKYVWEVV